MLNLAPAVEATTQLGYGANLVGVIGLIERLCLALYAIPRTAIVGALLLTGDDGGAVSTQMRAESPLSSSSSRSSSPRSSGGGVLLRDARLRALL